MEIALWIVAALTAVVNLFAGGMKILAVARYRTQAAWAENAPSVVIRGIGVLEVLGAIGIILPQLTGIGAPTLTILAAAGLVLIQAGAIVVHLRRREFSMLPVNIMLLALPLFVFLGRLLWV